DISLPADAAASETGADIWPPLRSAGTERSSPMSPVGGVPADRPPSGRSPRSQGKHGLKSRVRTPSLFYHRARCTEEWRPEMESAVALRSAMAAERVKAESLLLSPTR